MRDLYIGKISPVTEVLSFELSDVSPTSSSMRRGSDLEMEFNHMTQTTIKSLDTHWRFLVVEHTDVLRERHTLIYRE